MDGEDEAAQQKPGLRERIGRRAWVRAAALIGGGLIGGGLIAGGLIAGTVAAEAAGDGSAPGSSTSRQDARPGHGGGHRDPHGDGDSSRPQRADEELPAGETAAQVTEAVLAEHPDAVVQRVETDSGGVYEVTTDDERLTVMVDEDFEVTGTEVDAD